MDRGHVSAAHRARDETPDAVAGQVASLESVHPAERIGSRVIAVGVGRGHLASARPEGVVQVVAGVLRHPVAAFVELVGIRKEGPGSEHGLTGVPIDFLVKAVVIPDQVPERADQATRLTVPRRVRRHGRHALARVHERLKHLILADEDRAPRKVFGAARAEVAARIVDILFVHRHPDARARVGRGDRAGVRLGGAVAREPRATLAEDRVRGVGFDHGLVPVAGTEVRFIEQGVLHLERQRKVAP